MSSCNAALPHVAAPTPLPPSIPPSFLPSDHDEVFLGHIVGLVVGKSEDQMGGSDGKSTETFEAGKYIVSENMNCTAIHQDTHTHTLTHQKWDIPAGGQGF